MKITKRQLKRIIREAMLNEYYTPPKLPGLARQMGKSTQKVSRGAQAGGKRNPHGWSEFIEAAEARDYDAAGEWISGLAGDYGIKMSREEEDEFIEMGSFGGTAKELGQAWTEFLAKKE